MATLSELRTRVKNRASILANDGVLGDTEIDQAINDAIKQIGTEQDWPWQEASETINTVADTAEYTPASDWQRTRYLVDVDGTSRRRLRRRSTWDTDAIGFTGRPRIYSIDEEKIVVKPIPDDAYALTHRYIKKEKTLTDNGDSPLMPTEFDDGIVEFATYLLHRREGETSMAQQAAEAYNFWLRRTIDNLNRGKESLRIRIRSGHWMDAPGARG